MKKSVFFFFMVLVMAFCYVPAFAATGFYAMEVELGTGEVVTASEFTELDWRGDQPITIAFFQDGVPVQKTDLKLDGLERDTNKEDKYEDRFTPSTGVYQYANCIVVLDDYEYGQDLGKVSYNSSSVNFKLSEPYCQIIEYDEDEDEWVKSNKEFYALTERDENKEFYVNFYYADKLLDITSISFYDNQGKPIDSDIISADYEEYYKSKEAWLITYNQSVSGKAIISTSQEDYEMPVNIKYKHYFKDQFDNKVTEFLYVSGYNETLYLYGVTDTITEVTGGDKVDVVQKSGGTEFTVDTCTDEFVYSIEFETEELSVTIKPIVQDAATAGFYAIEVDEKSIGDEKIREVELRNDDTLSLIFFENDVLLERSALEIDGLYRNALEEAEYDTYFADNVVVIDGFLDEKDSGTISYNGSNVNFILKGLTYKTVELEDDGSEWSESGSKRDYIRRIKSKPYYARFYYDDAVLDVKDISFEDNNGDTIDASIIKATYNQDAEAWLITYTANIKGKAIIETANETYEMVVNIYGLDPYFGDENGKEYEYDEDDEINLEGFIYEKGVNEVFYLYNFTGNITEEVNGGDNISFVKEGGRIKFTVDNCSDSFNYKILLDNGEQMSFKITAAEYSFFAREVIIDDVSGTFTVNQERLKEISLVENEVKYFVFSDKGNKILIEEFENVNIKLSTNSVFSGKDVEGYVYEVTGDGNGNIYSNEDRQYNISVSHSQLFFWRYIEKSEKLRKIDEFCYEDGVTEDFYLYIEEFPLQANEVTILAGQNYVSLSDVIIKIADEDVSIVKITVDDTVPKMAELTLSISKWNATKSIIIENETIPSLPLRGIYTDYINISESTFCGEDECIYVAGDVFYYLWEEVDSCIDKDSKIKTDADVDIELIDTGRDVTLNGVTYDRYAIKITIPSDAEGELSGDFTVYYINSDGESKKDEFDLIIEDAYDYARTGEEWLNYNDTLREYVIGFTNDGEDTYTLNEYYNGYLADEEGIAHVENIPIKIFSITETEVGDEEVEAYIEVLDLYDNIKNIDIYVAEFNPRTLQYEKAANASNCVSVTQSKDSNGRWYANITNENLPGEYYIVAEVTMDDNTNVSIAMEYESTKLIEGTLDLSQQTWGIKEINEYIENVNSDANIINIKLNPNVAYGAGADDKQLVLQGDKEYHIDGNGATITGSVEAISPVESGRAPYHELTNIHFISDKSSIDDTTNICLDGTGQILATKCTFKNYYIASNMFNVAERKIVYGVKNAMNACVFENNKYGIYIDGKSRDSRFNESANEVKNCKFINNYTGIHIVEQDSIDRVEELLKFYNCEFIDNEFDIINKSDFKYMASGCVFAKTSASGIEARDPKTQKIEKSYVYRELILNFDNNGFIDGEPTLPKVAYAPLTKEGILDSFTIDNLKDIGVSIEDLKGAIKVVGEYILDLMDYLKLGTWKF